MTQADPAVVPMDAEVVAAAAAAAVEGCSVGEQINYWVRLGMLIERSGVAISERALAAADGRALFDELEPADSAAAHALVDARIAAAAATTTMAPGAAGERDANQ